MLSAPPTLAQDLNRVLLSGRLAEQPDLYDLSPGTIVCFLRLRCDRHSAPACLGEEGQLDVNVLLLGRRAANLSPYLYAGRRLVVDGALGSSDCETSGRSPAEDVCALAERVEFLDPPRPRTQGLLDSAAMVGFSEDARS